MPNDSDRRVKRTAHFSSNWMAIVAWCGR